MEGSKDEENLSVKKHPQLSYYYETVELDTYFSQDKVKIPEVEKVKFYNFYNLLY